MFSLVSHPGSSPCSHFLVGLVECSFSMVCAALYRCGRVQLYIELVMGTLSSSRAACCIKENMRARKPLLEANFRLLGMSHEIPSFPQVYQELSKSGNKSLVPTRPPSKCHVSHVVLFYPKWLLWSAGDEGRRKVLHCDTSCSGVCLGMRK